MAGAVSAGPSTCRPLYGSFAWAYDLVVAHPAGGPPERLVARLRSLCLPPGALVVDAGCGTGRYAQALSDARFRVVGVDRSAALIQEARARSTPATFVCADLLAWDPGEPVDGVLCRGVLNDLVADADRRAAIVAFASWLRADGVLLADVPDWDATAARYAAGRVNGSFLQGARGPLRFSSVTSLDGARHLMRVRERYAGTVDGVASDEDYDFIMRCWTPEELSAYTTAAGFASFRIRRGADGGGAADRLWLVARR